MFLKLTGSIPSFVACTLPSPAMAWVLCKHIHQLHIYEVCYGSSFFFLWFFVTIIPPCSTSMRPAIRPITTFGNHSTGERFRRDGTEKRSPPKRPEGLESLAMIPSTDGIDITCHSPSKRPKASNPINKPDHGEHNKKRSRNESNGCREAQKSSSISAQDLVRYSVDRSC